jgi:hypothetical protein
MRSSEDRKVKDDSFVLLPVIIADRAFVDDAAADIKDARRAWAPHGRQQALHCDGGAEDAARSIEAILCAAS